MRAPSKATGSGGIVDRSVDQTGRRLTAATFANRPAGHGQLEAWLDRHGPVRRVGVEGGANLGAGQRSLTAAGQLLADLPAVRAQVARRRILLRGLATSTTTVRIPVPLAMTLLHRPT